MTGVASVTLFFIGNKMIEDFASKNSHYGRVNYHIDPAAFRKDFRSLHDVSLKETFLERDDPRTPTFNKVIKDLNLLNPNLLRIISKTAFCWSKGDFSRVIIPIMTSEECKITIEEKVLTPKNFRVYWINTFKMHAIFNGDGTYEDKIFLVGSVPLDYRYDKKKWPINLSRRSSPLARYIF